MAGAYRSAYSHIVRARLAEVQLTNERVAPQMPRLHAIRGVRIARTLAGAVGLVGAIAVFGITFACDGAAATYALEVAVAAALCTYVVVRGVLAVMSNAEARRGPTHPALTGHLDVDLARIDARDLFQMFAPRLRELEVRSTTLPLAASSLLAPLSLHLAIFSISGSAERFAAWIRMSILLAGHAHLVLMVLAIAFGRRLNQQSSNDLARLPIHRAWVSAWGITVGVSLVPGFFSIAPPVLTAVTGLVCIPVMFIVMHRQLLRERTAIELAASVAGPRIRVDERADAFVPIVERAFTWDSYSAERPSRLVAQI